MFEFLSLIELWYNIYNSITDLLLIDKVDLDLDYS